MATTRRACEIHFAVGGSGPEHGFQTSVRSPHIGWKGHLQAIVEALVSRAAQTGDRRKRCESGISRRALDPTALCEPHGSSKRACHTPAFCAWGENCVSQSRPIFSAVFQN